MDLRHVLKLHEAATMLNLRAAAVNLWLASRWETSRNPLYGALSCIMEERQGI